MHKLRLFSNNSDEKPNRYNDHVEKIEQCIKAVDALNNAVDQYVKHPSKEHGEKKQECEQQVSESCANMSSNRFK